MTTRLRTIAVASALVLTLPLTACIGGGEPGPTPTNTTVSTTAPPPSTATPTPTPTWKCSSATGASCTQSLAEKEAAIAEAQETYADYTKMYEEALGDVDVKSVPPALATLIDGPMVEPVKDSITKFRAQKIRLVGHSTVRLTSPIADVKTTGAEMTMTFCVDASATASITVPDGRYLGTGKVGLNSTTFRKKGNKWILWSQTQKAVEAC